MKHNIILFLNSRGLLNFIPDKFIISYMYYKTFKKKINLREPKTFNEKLQWLKLNDRNPLYTKLVDKILVKEYISDNIGEEYVIPTIDVANTFDEIEFKKLPKQFVIKCNHDSGGVVICKDKDKFDIKKAKKIINASLKKNYYINGREWPYKFVKPRILVEQFMIDKELNELRDYKFFCFNGKVEYFKVDFDRFINHKANYYNREGIIQPFGEEVCPPDFERKIVLPSNIEKMILLAEKLSKGISFVRIDFYDINNKIYFGEMTFYPASGFGKFIPQEWDLTIGEKLKISKKEGAKYEDNNRE